jgi:hypothetical protein
MFEENKIWLKWSRYLGFYFVFSIIGSFLLTGTLYSFHFSLIFLLLIFYLSYFFFHLNKFSSTKKFLWRLFYVSFVIRILFVFIFYWVFEYFLGHPFLTFKDDYVYSQISSQIAKSWKISGIYFDLSAGFYSGYVNFGAFLTYIFGGDSIIMPRIGNAFFSSLTVMVIYKNTMLFSKQSHARLVATLLVFSPLLITFSSIQFKDTLLLFITAVLIFNLSKMLVTGFSLLSFIYIFLFSILCILFRPANLVPVYAAFFIILSYNLLIKHNFYKGIKNYLILFGIVSLFVYTWNWLSSLDYISSFQSYYDSRIVGLQKDFSSTDVGLVGTSWAKFIGAPLLVGFSVFLPPTLIVSLPDAETINYAFLGMITHFSLLPFLVLSIINVIRYRKKYVIPFFILLVIVFFKIGQAKSIISIFDPRQSLATITCMYLLLPLYFEKGKKKLMLSFVLICSSLILIVYAFVRLSSRGLI